MGKKQAPAQFRNRIVEYGVKPADQFMANPSNPRVHPQFQRDVMRSALETVGFVAPVIEARNGYLLDGHERVYQALANDNAPVPYVVVDVDDDEANYVLATFDPITGLATYDRDILGELLETVNSDDAAVQQMLEDLLNVALPIPQEYNLNGERVDPPTLADRFIVPPFSVLDARQGYWQDRKQRWLSIGIQSELGRGDNPRPSASNRDIRPGRDSGDYTGGDAYLGAPKRINGKLPADNGGQPLPLDRMKNGKSPARKFGQDLMRGEHTVGTSRKEADKRSNVNNAPPTLALAVHTGTENMAPGTSIFDPVLCELAYRWFTPVDALTLDPFAGGSVRGIVAHKLNRRYVGIELRDEQVEANRQQGAALTPDNPPTWITGDSVNVQALAPNTYDFVFTCPPYADLEIYSDDPRDISNMPYEAFLSTYRAIIAASCAMLADDRFACIVVGDVRDKQGNYRNFVSDTIQAFIDAGLSLYNEAILVTAIGSLPVRVGRMFESGRKLGKTHQNVLVFVKGNAKRAAEYCGVVEYELLDIQAQDLTQ